MSALAEARVLSEEEATRWVIDLLSRGKPLETREIDEASKASGVACPDSTARFLSRMRVQGLVEGKLDVARKTWIWWRK